MKRFFDYKESGDKGPYSIKPIPTKYKGRWYRSRLEAKWAVMFDSLKWNYEYEPCQIEGHNPDFIIHTTSKAYETNTIIVEVKPSHMVDAAMLEATQKKYENVKAHILVVTDMPFRVSQSGYNHVIVGYGSTYYSTGRTHIADEIVMKSSTDCSSFTYGWDGLIKGRVKRKDFVYTNYTAGEKVYERLQLQWANAGNKTQFEVKNKKK